MNTNSKRRSTVGAAKAVAAFLMVVASLLLVGALAKPAYAQDGALQAGVLLDAQAALSTQSTVVESEPNDEFDQATQVSAGDVVYGELDDRKYDYYKVNITQKGQVSLTFANDEYRSGGWNFDATIYNPYYESVGSISVNERTTRPVCKTFNFTETGVYFIRVSNFISDRVGHPYHLKLAYEIGGSDITSVVPAAKSGVVKWTKRINASKYQLRYATVKNMSGAKIINVDKDKTSKKIKKLEKNKKYFVQVRVVRTIDGKDWYSSWSTKKVLKTRK